MSRLYVLCWAKMSDFSPSLKPVSFAFPWNGHFGTDAKEMSNKARMTAPQAKYLIRSIENIWFQFQHGQRVRFHCFAVYHISFYVDQQMLQVAFMIAPARIVNDIASIEKSHVGQCLEECLAQLLELVLVKHQGLLAQPLGLFVHSKPFLRDNNGGRILGSVRAKCFLDHGRRLVFIRGNCRNGSWLTRAPIIMSLRFFLFVLAWTWSSFISRPSLCLIRGCTKNISRRLVIANVHAWHISNTLILHHRTTDFFRLCRCDLRKMANWTKARHLLFSDHQWIFALFNIRLTSNGTDKVGSVFGFKRIKNTQVTLYSLNQSSMPKSNVVCIAHTKILSKHKCLNGCLFWCQHDHLQHFARIQTSSILMLDELAMKNK